MKGPGKYFCWARHKMLTRTETGSEFFYCGVAGVGGGHIPTLRKSGGSSTLV